jgi:hypothetical protein
LVFALAYPARETLSHPGILLSAPLNRPPNDDFQHRTALTEDYVSVTAVFTGATSEPEEPENQNDSIWWEWRATRTETFSFSAVSAVLPVGIQIFTGSELENLARVAPQLPFPRTASCGLRAIKGQTYVIRVDSLTPGRGTVTLQIEPGPKNDDIARATPLFGNHLITNCVVTGATFEEEEDIFEFDLPSSVWWHWTPESQGHFNIQATLASPPLVLAAFRHDSTGNLALITKRIADTDPPSVRLAFFADQGEPVLIKAASRVDNTSEIEIRIWKAPDNDNFTDAAHLTEVFTSGNTHGATAEPGEPLIESGSTPIQSVWYRWTPVLNGGYEIDLNSGDGENTLFLFDGTSFESLILLRQVNAPAGEWRSFNFPAEQLHHYFLAVNSSLPGGDSFGFSIQPGPPNDAFTNRIALYGHEVYLTASTAGATRESDEPAHDPSLPDRTLWWEWTAPNTGGFCVEVAAEDIPPWLVVYQGQDLTNLFVVPSERVFTDSTQPYVTSTTFRANAGEKYIFLLYAGQQVSFELQVRRGPLNDEFDQALDIFLNDERSELLTRGATLEPSEPVHPVRGSSVWYRFTAPTNGTYVLLPTGADVCVYLGSSLDKLELIEFSASSVFSSFLPIRAAAGEVFMIALTIDSPWPYKLRIVPGTQNDDFQNRANLVGEFVLENPAWSTVEPGESLLGADSSGTVWWRWSTVWQGQYAVHLSIPGSKAAVFAGESLLNLQRIAQSETDSPNLLIFHAESNTEYSIAVSHTDSAHNLLRISINPANQNVVPPSPRLELISLTRGDLLLSANLTGGVRTTIDGSTNLLDWVPWTNINPNISDLYFFQFQRLEDAPPQFFRARVEP